MERDLFERVAGPLNILNPRLAVGRCPSCGTSNSLFIDLKTGDWRCGRLPDGFLQGGNGLKTQASPLDREESK